MIENFIKLMPGTKQHNAGNSEEHQAEHLYLGI